MISSE